MSSRFQRLKTDPRFRKPRKHANKVEIDPRFRSVLQEGSEKKNVKVDKYGRKIASSHEKDLLRKFYRLPDDGQEDGSQKVDYARGEGLIESSEEEEDVKESDEEGDIIMGEDPSKPIAVLEDEAEIDLDESQFAALDALAEANLETSRMTGGTTDKATARLAAVNLDWDHVKAGHLFKIFSSQLSMSLNSISSSKQRNGAGTTNGRLLHVRVYPSEFGEKRMAEEDKNGPPADLFRSKEEHPSEEPNGDALTKPSNGEEYDQNALRRYQLERLRYYYAIASFDSPHPAALVYDELDGTELERSANLFDLSYVPEDMEFDDGFREEARFESSSYQPLNFTTDASCPAFRALRHSNVKLTWDEDDPERTRVTRRTLSKKEIDEIDFKDLIMSASSEDEDETSTKDVQRLRALLLSDNEEHLPEGWGGTRYDKADEMEITFTPGLSGEVNKGAKTGPEDETTLERYQRKERERKKAKKAARNERIIGKEDTTASKSKKSKRIDDEFFGEDSGPDEGEDSGHSDTKRTNSKSFKSKKRGTDKDKRSKNPISAEAATDAELSLIMDPSSTSGQKHFDMTDIIRSERRAEKSGKKHRSKRKRVDVDGEGGQGSADVMEINLEDPRFRSVYSDPRFAIDPANPHFKKTKSMKKLLVARSKGEGVELSRSGDNHGKKRRKRD